MGDEKYKNFTQHLSDAVLIDWISSFLWFCWPEHGISPGEAAKIVCSVTADYLKAFSQGLPYHFPIAEALASKFDFEPNRTRQNDNGEGSP